MAAIKVSAGAVLEAVNPSGIQQLKASTTADAVEQLQIAKVSQFPPERLRYCPTDDFLDLHHGRRLQEGISIDFRYERLLSNCLAP